MDFQSEKIKLALKKQLRAQKIGYREVAEHLGCSVPTVKRILGPEELTLSRLFEILELLDLRLSELELLAGQSEARETVFTPKQQEYLLKNKSSLAYLLKLYDGMSPKQIAEKYGLPQRSTDRYLIGLERAELIRVSGRQKVRPTHREIPRLSRGPLGNAYFESLIQSGANFFIHWLRDNVNVPEGKAAERPTTYQIHYSKISPESYQRLSGELKKIMDEFNSLSRFEEKTLPKDKLRTAAVTVAHALTPNDYAGLQDVEDIFGPVTPI